MYRHGRHLNQWIVIDGVRNSYRGKLLSVDEFGSEAILSLHPVYALESLAGTEGEVRLETSPDAPFELYSQAILGLGRQPKAWPEK